MKVCDNCNRVNSDEEESCIECEGTEFTELLSLLEEEG